MEKYIKQITGKNKSHLSFLHTKRVDRRIFLMQNSLTRIQIFDCVMGKRIIKILFIFPQGFGALFFLVFNYIYNINN